MAVDLLAQEQVVMAVQVVVVVQQMLALPQVELQLLDKVITAVEMVVLLLHHIQPAVAAVQELLVLMLLQAQ